MKLESKNKVEEWSGSIEPCNIAGAHHAVICDTSLAHKVEIALRKSGYEIRDSLKWLYSSAGSIRTKTIVLGRLPLEGTVAENVLKYGTGALNIAGCRVGTEAVVNNRLESWSGFGQKVRPDYVSSTVEGRWPANVLHDGSEEVVALFPDSNGSGAARTLNRGKRAGSEWGMADRKGDLRDAGEGSAARFFYNTSQDGVAIEGLKNYLWRLLV